MPNGELLGGCGVLHGELGTVVLDLGGEPQEKVVNPSVEAVVVVPDEKRRLTKVTVNAVTSEIDANIVPTNIRKGKTILGVEGNLEPDKPDQSKRVEPKTEEQTVVADTGYELASVTVGAVTSAIDGDIKAENIREGVDILGVAGTMVAREDLDGELAEQVERLAILRATAEGLPEPEDVTGVKDITVNGVYKASDDGLIGYSQVNVNAREDLDAELNQQDTLLAELQSSVEELPEKPVDMLQWKCDNMKTLYYEFCHHFGTRLTEQQINNICDRLDTSEVVDFDYTFATSYITKAPKIDTRGAKYMQSTFQQSQIDEFPSHWNFQNLESGSSMLYMCSKLTTLYIPDTVEFKEGCTLGGLCLYCSNLTNATINIKAKLSSLNAAFQYCNKLQTAILNITVGYNSSGAGISSLFAGCSSLETVDGTLNLSECISFSGAFSDCSKLTTIPLIDLAGVINIVGVRSMFSNCKALTNLILKNIKFSLQIGSGTSWGTLLTDNSIVNTFQELWDLTGSSTQTLTLSTPSLARTGEIYVKLIDVTDEMREEDEYIDNKKPCVVCESTDAGAMTLREYGISKNWNIA